MLALFISSQIYKSYSVNKHHLAQKAYSGTRALTLTHASSKTATTSSGRGPFLASVRAVSICDGLLPPIIIPRSSEVSAEWCCNHLIATSVNVSPCLSATTFTLRNSSRIGKYRDVNHAPKGSLGSKWLPASICVSSRCKPVKNPPLNHNHNSSTTEPLRTPQKNRGVGGTYASGQYPASLIPNFLKHGTSSASIVRSRQLYTPSYAVGRT